MYDLKLKFLFFFNVIFCRYFESRYIILAVRIMICACMCIYLPMHINMILAEFVRLLVQYVNNIYLFLVVVLSISAIQKSDPAVLTARARPGQNWLRRDA